MYEHLSIMTFFLDFTTLGNIFSIAYWLAMADGSVQATGKGIFVSDIQEQSAAFHVSIQHSYMSSQLPST